MLNYGKLKKLYYNLHNIYPIYPVNYGDNLKMNHVYFHRRVQHFIIMVG